MYLPIREQTCSKWRKRWINVHRRCLFSIHFFSASHCITRMLKFACSYHFWSRKPCFRLFQKKVNSTFSLFLLEMYIREKNGIFTKIVLQSYQKRFACNLSIFDVNHSALCDLLTWYHSSTLVWRHLEVVVEYERGLRKKETLDFLFFVSNSFFFSSSSLAVSFASFYKAKQETL